MTNENNQLTVLDNNTGEIIQSNGNVVRETNKHVVMLNEKGKYIRKAKYEEYSSMTFETREDKIFLAQLFGQDNENDENSLKNNIGKEFELANVITRPYSSIDEDTGEEIHGVITYLFTPEKEVFITSSKTVYFTLFENYFKLFGRPDYEEYENLKVKVTSRRGTNGTILDLKLIG